MKSKYRGAFLCLLLVLPEVFPLNPNCPNCRIRRHRLAGHPEEHEGTFLERRPLYGGDHHPHHLSGMSAHRRRRKRIHPFRRHRLAEENKEDKEEEDDYVITAVIINDDDENEDMNYQEPNDYRPSDSEEGDEDYEKTSYLTTKIADKFQSVAEHFDVWSQNFESVKVATPKRGHPREDGYSSELECPLVQGSPSCRQYDGQDECSDPGQRDSSCPQGLCCFNGCSNVCFRSSFLQIKPPSRMQKNKQKPRCPKPKAFKECNLYERSECWSPGVPDLDCPGSAFCCFDGCRNVCAGGAKGEDEEERDDIKRQSGTSFPEFPNFYSFTSSGSGVPDKKSSSLSFAGQPQIHAPKSTIQIYPVSFMPHENGPSGSIYAVPIEEEGSEEEYPILQNGEEYDEHDDEESYNHNDKTSLLINRLSKYHENSEVSDDDDYYNTSGEEGNDESPYVTSDRHPQPVENVIRLTKGSQKPVIYITNTFHIPSGVDVSGSQIPEGIQIEDYDPNRKDKRRRSGLRKDSKRQGSNSDRRTAHHRYSGLLTPQETIDTPSSRRCPSVPNRSPFCRRDPGKQKCFKPNQFDSESCHGMCCFDGCQYSCVQRPPLCKDQTQCPGPSSLETCGIDEECSERESTCCFDGCRNVCMSQTSRGDESQFVSELLSSPDLIKSSLENYFLG